MVTVRYGDGTPLGLLKVVQGTSESFPASFVDMSSKHQVEGYGLIAFFPRAKTQTSPSWARTSPYLSWKLSIVITANDWEIMMYISKVGKVGLSE
jgi:hypothetical protein